MIIERQLNCTAREFFDVLVEAMINDINISTDHKIKKSRLKEGYSYTKTIVNKKNQQARATITKYDENNRLCLQTMSDQGTTIMDYEIKEINDHLIQILYKEEYRKNNGKLYDGFFYKHSVKKRMSLYFSRLEKYINSRK